MIENMIWAGYRNNNTLQALKEDYNIPEEHRGEILLLVNSQQAGRVVGKGGEKLKTIRLVSFTSHLIMFFNCTLRKFKIAMKFEKSISQLSK